VCPDTRYRCHRKSSLHDADLAGFGSLSPGSASFLTSRSIRNDEPLRDLSRNPLQHPSTFLKASSESSYLSILPKVILRSKEKDFHLTQGSACALTRDFIMVIFLNVFSEAAISRPKCSKLLCLL
jgi:hypothetical protein